MSNRFFSAATKLKTPVFSNNIAFIGTGKAAERFINGLVDSSLQPAHNIIISERNKTRKEFFRNKGFGVAENIAEALQNAEVVVLDVEPQSCIKIFQELKDQNTSAILISLSTGISIENIQHGTNMDRVVRVFPNCTVFRKNIALWTHSPRITEEEKETIKNFLSTFGDELNVEYENNLNVASNLGSLAAKELGKLKENLIHTGTNLGLSTSIATQLAGKLCEPILENGQSKVNGVNGTNGGVNGYHGHGMEYDFENALQTPFAYSSYGNELGVSGFFCH